jgi:hypothetical protein
VRTSGIDLNGKVWCDALNMRGKHRFRRGRPADVAHADEQNPRQRSRY